MELIDFCLHEVLGKEEIPGSHDGTGNPASGIRSPSSFRMRDKYDEAVIRGLQDSGHAEELAEYLV
jgi:hypothetical protein